MRRNPRERVSRVSRASGVGLRGPRPSTKAQGVPSLVEGRERARQGGAAGTKSPRPSNDAGFSLAEALIATLLSSVVIGGALHAFSDGMRLYDTSRLISETNQSLQSGISLMVRDFIQTGQGIPTGGIPLPSGAGAMPVTRPGPVPLTFPAGWTTVPALTPGSSLGPAVLGVQTDIVTLLYADATLPLNVTPLSAISPSGLSMTVDPGTNIFGPNGLREGDLILFSNANGNALQMITRTSASQTVFFDPGDPLNLNQPGASQGNLLGIQSSPGVFPPTTATRVLMISYYVDTATDPTLPRLVRQINARPSNAVSFGVENLQFSYDLVDGTVNPANVPEPPPGNSPNQIRKVNLFMSARSLDLAPVPRQFFRNSMATEVGLRSLS